MSLEQLVGVRQRDEGEGNADRARRPREDERRSTGRRSEDVRSGNWMPSESILSGHGRALAADLKARGFLPLFLAFVQFSFLLLLLFFDGPSGEREGARGDGDGEWVEQRNRHHREEQLFIAENKLPYVQRATLEAALHSDIYVTNGSKRSFSQICIEREARNEQQHSPYFIPISLLARSRCSEHIHGNEYFHAFYLSRHAATMHVKKLHEV